MARDRNLVLRAALLMLLAGFAASTTFISADVFESHGSTGRALLQEKKSCSVNFEFLNYTVITSKCKGPQYLASACCSAFKELACPYAEQIDDESTECASTMFSYINLYGKYPPGLFASECKEGKEGLACPPLSEAANGSSSTQIKQSLIFLMISMSGFVMTFLLS